MTNSSNYQMTRQQRLEQIKLTDGDWDLIIVGGGIIGAGILKRASQLKLKVLLLEQKDFAWGSSSRSSKMVHGGFRYIAEGQIKLTIESVLEREKLLRDTPQLINRQSFAVSHYKKQFPWRWLFNAVILFYDAIAGIKQHKFFSKSDYNWLVPKVKQQGLIGGTQFFDALTEDARLVQRLIQEALQLGAQAINYCHVTRLIEQEQRVTGVEVKAEEATETFNLQAKMVINATGAWTNELLEKLSTKLPLKQGKSKTVNIRPLRGSHLILPWWRLPVASAITVLHPVDNRPVQIYPWQNVTVVGTTDIEHQQPMANEAKINQQELDYLMQTIDYQFPLAKIKEIDILSTFAGVRPVVTHHRGNTVRADKKIAPSKEKREHCIFQRPGLITIAGGKLTTFDLIAKQILRLVITDHTDFSSPVFEPVCRTTKKSMNLPEHIQNQIIACYGVLSDEFIRESATSELNTISYSRHLWAELLWAAKYEQVQHLDDLLLRRTRLGNVLPKGGIDYLPEVKKLSEPGLAWGEEKWQREISRYINIWQTSYSLPGKK